MKGMESLGKIFGSKHRVKIMRLFLFNEHEVFDLDDISSRTRVKKPDLRKEITMLGNIGFIKKKSFIKKVPKTSRKKNAKPEFKNVRKKGYTINARFDLLKPLQTLLIDSELIKSKELIKRIKKSGRIKLLILSGLFVRDKNRKLDILIVGERIKRDLLEKEIAIIESEIGRELAYAFFDQQEYEYRLSMYDKLVRDIMENAHRRLVDTL